MTLGREASEEGDKTSNIVDDIGSDDEFQMLLKVVCFKAENEVVVVLKAHRLPKKKKNHCNDATEGNRGSCAELERQN